MVFPWRWAPLGLILLTSAVCWVLILRGGMTGIAAWYVFQIGVPVIGLASLLVVFTYAFLTRRYDKGLFASLVGCAAAVVPAASLFGFLEIAYPASVDSMAPSVTVRLPADGPLRVAWGGDNVDVNYHAVVPDQRWAYDLLIEPYLSGSKELADYGCFGATVLAPVSGRVSRAHDGEPDVVPGRSSMNLERPFGNHVVIELPSGTYLVVAHLQQGSVLVKTGEAIDEGQPIGLCGNSGNTSEPHIHIHHQRQDPAEYPVNFAEGLPLYFRDHDGPPMPEGGIRHRRGKPVAIGAAVQHRSR